MKTISKLLASLGVIASFAASGPQARAQQEPPGVGFVRIVNAVAPGEGKANIIIDGEDIFPKGYNLGQKTGGFGLTAGPHTISFRKSGVESGTTKITLSKGETLTLIGFAEKVAAEKPDDPPVWRTKLLHLKQSEPEHGYGLALVSLCPQDEIKVQTEVQGRPKPEMVYAKRLVVTRMNLGKSKKEVLLKAGGETVARVLPEDPGNYVVLLYEDAAGKVKALSFYDPKFVVAG